MCIYIHIYTHIHNILIYILIKPYNLEFVHEHIIIFEFGFLLIKPKLRLKLGLISKQLS